MTYTKQGWVWRNCPFSIRVLNSFGLIARHIYLFDQNTFEQSKLDVKVRFNSKIYTFFCNFVGTVDCKTSIITNHPKSQVEIVPLMSQSRVLGHKSLDDEENISPINASVANQTPYCASMSPIIFLLLTLLLTLSATGLLCTAIVTDHWEIIKWDRSLLDQLANNSGYVLYWHFDDKVARIPVSRKLPVLYHCM